MKIRNGFVSNSSSSSFLIFGKSFDSIKDFKLSKEIQEQYDEDFDTYEAMESVIPYKEKDIEYHIMEYDDTIYVGQSWGRVKDDETGLQFKERTVMKMNELLGTNYTINDLSTIEQSWYG